MASNHVCNAFCRECEDEVRYWYRLYFQRIDELVRELPDVSLILVNRTLQRLIIEERKLMYYCAHGAERIGNARVTAAESLQARDGA